MPELLQRIEQRRGQSSPGRAQRMAKGDGSAVDVDLAEVGPDLAGPRQHHRGERLVDLLLQRRPSIDMSFLTPPPDPFRFVRGLAGCGAGPGSASAS